MEYAAPPEKPLQAALEQTRVVSTTETELEKKPRLLRDFGFNFLVIGVLFYFVHAILSQGNLLDTAPIYSDDFDYLASTITHLKSSAFRPLSAFIYSVLGALGIKTLFAATQLLAITYTALVFTYFKSVLQLTRIPLLVNLSFTALASTLAVSFESFTHFYYFGGSLTNTTAGCFAVISALIFIAHSDKPRNLSLSLTPAILLIASILCKEDFAVPFGIFYLYIITTFDSSSSTRKWAASTLGISVAAGLAILCYQKFGISSQFFSGTSEHYAMNLEPSSIVSTCWKYLTHSNGAIIASVMQLLATIFIVVRGSLGEKSKFALLSAQIVTMLVPFGFFPNHFLEYFAFNWICWQSALCFIFAREFLPVKTGSKNMIVTSICLCVCSLILSICVVSATQQRRHDLLGWFAHTAQINKNVEQTLSQYHDQISNAPLVAVLNAPTCGPWTANNGAYLRNRLHLHCNWLLLTPENSDYHGFVSSFGGTRGGSIEIKTYSGALPKLDIPTFKFDNDGNGILFPNSESTEISPAAITAPKE